MANAITSSTAAAADKVPQHQPTGLDVDLARCETQLSDWTHCGSANTPDGKAKIAAISEKIVDIKAKMHKAQEAHSKANPVLAPAVDSHLVSGVPRAAALNSLGGFVDLHA